MPELSGINCIIKVPGTPVAMIGEATSSSDDKVYTITNTSKRVLDIRVPYAAFVNIPGTNKTAEAGTTVTNVRLTAHGLVTGDIIVNSSRASAMREVTYVDANNFTVASVTGQTTGDGIIWYKKQSALQCAIHPIKGTVTFAAAASRLVIVSGSYLPMSTAAYAHKASHAREAAILDTTPFGATYKQRIAGLKSASGTLAQFNIADAIFTDALTNGSPVLIEHTEDISVGKTMFWAHLESSEVEAAIEDLQDNTVSWISHDLWLRLGV